MFGGIVLAGRIATVLLTLTSRPFVNQPQHLSPVSVAARFRNGGFGKGSRSAALGSGISIAELICGTPPAIRRAVALALFSEGRFFGSQTNGRASYRAYRPNHDGAIHLAFLP